MVRFKDGQRAVPTLDNHDLAELTARRSRRGRGEPAGRKVLPTRGEHAIATSRIETPCDPTRVVAQALDDLEEPPSLAKLHQRRSETCSVAEASGTRLLREASAFIERVETKAGSRRESGPQQAWTRWLRILACRSPEPCVASVRSSILMACCPVVRMSALRYSISRCRLQLRVDSCRPGRLAAVVQAAGRAGGRSNTSDSSAQPLFFAAKRLG